MRSFLATTLLGSLAAAAPQSPSHHGSHGWGDHDEGHWEGHWGGHHGNGDSDGNFYNGGSTVNVKNGTISGYYQPTYDQEYFLGVPFAQPPVGDLRFRNPQSINTTFDGTYEATEYAPECVGYGGDQIGYPVSEDCLYLNVVRPAGYENESLPVGVWIHGGGLYMGGTRDERYNLSFIVDNSVQMGKPIIGVSIAYRLSAWGFLASEEVSGSGQTNIGLRDQRLALHWLNENIGAFGGDADKVTIWGESAGAASVGWHLTAYNGRDDGIFRAGIMESGNPVAYSSYKTNQQYQPAYDAIVNMTNCSTSIDTLQCLRNVPYEDLNAIFNTTEYQSLFDPIVDGDFIARWTSIQLAEGAFVHVPIIDGANTGEGASFGQSGINTTQQFIDAATSNMTQAPLPSQFGDQLPDAYPLECDYFIPPESTLPCDFSGFPSSFGDAEQYRRQAAYFGDVVMIANRRGACEAWTREGVDAYSYRFDTTPNGVAYYMGVPHFQEVAFVFDNVDGLGYDAEHGTVNPFANESSSYTQLAELMSKSWASFIYDLDPNGFKDRYDGADAWPVYSLDKPQNIVWDGNATGTLAYAEDDTWRAEGIQFILDHALAYGR
ncbi:hypothetical protein D0868_10751 [Hortaea werneckii]|uniref:Carboxylic ester hydrolase n=1 Tax=Hortaea werneckii TaxID=91943 RepID=A0A3M6Y360_HORWE|nr:hypothetical protein D0868_10751 [Hortaea werneckii]